MTVSCQLPIILHAVVRSAKMRRPRLPSARSHLNSELNLVLVTVV